MNEQTEYSVSVKQKLIVAALPLGVINKASAREKFLSQRH